MLELKGGPPRRLLHRRHLEQSLHSRALRDVLAETGGEHLVQLLRVVLAEGGVFAARDLHDDLGHVGAREGRAEHGHLVQDAPQAPHVAFEVVGLALTHLRGEVEGRAQHGVRHVHRRLHQLGHPEVPELHHDLAVLVVVLQGRDEDVGGLDVAVDDLGRMGVLQRKHDLSEDVPHLRLGERLPRLGHGLDVVCEGPILCKLCEDVEPPVLLEVVDVLHDVDVVEVLQHVHLVPPHRVRLLASHLHLLGDQQAVVLDAPHKDRAAKGAMAQALALFIRPLVVIELDRDLAAKRAREPRPV
mmetsp:Transcript_29294/g.93736  ORF Transcript_29294/g.93736 Transcript_29294/m.93736 type:complete len:300 (-) Transcript_29294:476-1375(-)